MYEASEKGLVQAAMIGVKELIEILPDLEKLLIKSRNGLEMGGKTEIMVDNARDKLQAVSTCMKLVRDLEKAKKKKGAGKQEAGKMEF